MKTERLIDIINGCMGDGCRNCPYSSNDIENPIRWVDKDGEERVDYVLLQCETYRKISKHLLDNEGGYSSNTPFVRIAKEWLKKELARETNLV